MRHAAAEGGLHPPIGSPGSILLFVGFYDHGYFVHSRAKKIVELVFVVEDIGELVVENVSDAVEFIVVLDSFENVVSVFVRAEL